MDENTESNEGSESESTDSIRPSTEERITTYEAFTEIKEMVSKFNKNELNDLKEVSTENFSLGIQLGGGVELGRLGLDIRWERGLSKTETVFVDNTINDTNFNFDKRVSQIIFGISYRLTKSKKDE